MKSFFAFLTVSSALLLLLASTAMARGPQGIENTIHNLSTYNDGWTPYGSSNEDRVCVFCHTPHGGSLNGPLWNHDVPGANSFTHYSSATLTTAASNTARPMNKESLICMSCHDGSIAVNRVLNQSANGQIEIGGVPNEVFVVGGPVPGPRIGGGPVAGSNGSGDLRDDHPISFNYNDAYLQEVSDGDNGLVATATVIGDAKVRLFGTAEANMRVECSSCHDPHVDYNDPDLGLGVGDAAYTPFLIYPNTGSGLCLACHVK